MFCHFWLSLKFIYDPSTTQVECGEQYSLTVAMTPQLLGVSAPLCHISQWSIVLLQSTAHSEPAMVLPSITRKPETCCELWFQSAITLQWRNDIYQHHKRRKKWFEVISAKSLPMISVFLALISFDRVFMQSKLQQSYWWSWGADAAGQNDKAAKRCLCVVSDLRIYNT